MFSSKILLVLTLTLSFAQIALAAEQKVEDKKQTAEITGDEEVYVVSNVAATDEISGTTKKPVVEFSLMSSSFLAHKVNRGSYCNIFTIKGFASAKSAKAVRDALVRAKKVQVDPKSFKTSRRQELHNDAVPASQERFLAQNKGKAGFGSSEPSRCYTYDIDAGKINTANAEGEKSTLEAEAKKDKNYNESENAEAALKSLQAELKLAESEVLSFRTIFTKTAGHGPKEKIKKHLAEAESRVVEIKKSIAGK